ncbi:MAG: NAD(P)H-hydrate dehydratase [Pseudomonadota bacterium]
MSTLLSIIVTKTPHSKPRYSSSQVDKSQVDKSQVDKSQTDKTGLYTAEQVRQLDKLAIDQHGIPAAVLMKRAGRAAFAALISRWSTVASLQIFCGSGNNGGDGYVLAALAAQQGISVTVWQLSAQLSPVAQRACHYALQEGVQLRPFVVADCQVVLEHQQDDGQQSVLVDALLGTGAKGALTDNYRNAIVLINNSAWPTLALDMPSGIDANTGAIEDIAVKADLTVSFIAQKLGNRIGPGRVAAGTCVFDDLNVPNAIYQGLEPDAQILELSECLPTLPELKIDAHKGDCGHLLIVGGDQGFGGAVLMAGQMAARAGAGLVGVATRPAHTEAIIARQPELMAAAVSAGQELSPLLQKPAVLVIGPGLGRSAWSEQLLYFALQANKPMVLDADALNLLADQRMPWPRAEQPQWILTPHPGEAARLLNSSIDDVQNDRMAALTELQSRFGGAVILKGAGSLVISSAKQIYLCEQGNPGMASGGMGDVLSGLLGSLLAQGLCIDKAACLGVVLHAAAGDMCAAERGRRALLATDLIDAVAMLMSGDR